MADNLETVLRNSLDAVDRGRRWAILGVIALFVATAIAVAGLFAVAVREGNAPVFIKALFVAAATQMLFVACCTVALMFHVTRTTKAILREIEVYRGERASEGHR
jgi:hypothetical protein